MRGAAHKYCSYNIKITALSGTWAWVVARNGLRETLIRTRLGWNLDLGLLGSQAKELAEGGVLSLDLIHLQGRTARDGARINREVAAVFRSIYLYFPLKVLIVIKNFAQRQQIISGL